MKYSSRCWESQVKGRKLPVAGEEKRNGYLSSRRFFLRTVCRAMLALPFKEHTHFRAEKSQTIRQRIAMKTSKIESKHHYRTIQFNVARDRVILIGRFPQSDSFSGGEIWFVVQVRIAYRLNRLSRHRKSCSFFAAYEPSSDVINVESRNFFCSPLKSITQLSRCSSFRD